MCRVWYAIKTIKKKKQKKRRKKSEQPRTHLQTITDQGVILEQKHDTPPSLYLDHQQTKVLSFSSVVSDPSFDEFFLEVPVQL
jgi:hypothetical protein